MRRAVRPDDTNDATPLSRRFVQAMRGFAGAVCVVTVADGDERSGFTATSVSSFSAEPPMVVASLKATSSSAGLLARTRRFGVNLLRAEHRAIAERFTGFRGEQGAARYGDDEWVQMTPDGAPLLGDSVVAMDCEVEEMLVRHGHILIIGRVRALARDESAPSPLVYWQGQYTALAGPLAAAR
ncbi:flavin reductase family protein [Paraburkholderia sp. CNPSo 3274]|uniref:flavin reductase family protein n=1 Tax=Paraburkholderia sp. CNPSo 3274 TaxID=2940932 RepID=UPI0020B70055|nr:flavin reductase family protein [Paraburkholderia sp. CNPSo 3274]MCP3710810.1 flavin reductase family protein [Paraburkholderia sp. CNPSo 3274]